MISFNLLTTIETQTGETLPIDGQWTVSVPAGGVWTLDEVAGSSPFGYVSGSAANVVILHGSGTWNFTYTVTNVCGSGTYTLTYHIGESSITETQVACEVTGDLADPDNIANTGYVKLEAVNDSTGYKVSFRCIQTDCNAQVINNNLVESNLTQRARHYYSLPMDATSGDSVIQRVNLHKHSGGTVIVFLDTSVKFNGTNYNAYRDHVINDLTTKLQGAPYNFSASDFELEATFTSTGANQGLFNLYARCKNVTTGEWVGIDKTATFTLLVSGYDNGDPPGDNWQVTTMQEDYETLAVDCNEEIACGSQFTDVFGSMNGDDGTICTINYNTIVPITSPIQLDNYDNSGTTTCYIDILEANFEGPASCSTLTYQWSSTGGGTLVGETGQTLQVELYGADTYTVEITCTDLSFSCTSDGYVYT